MKRVILVLLTLVLLPNLVWAQVPKKVTFPSRDGLTITADLYLKHKNKDTPFIVLFHQATWGRGAYREIAPRLNALGFNTMAVDLRSGGTVNKINNETKKRAVRAGKGTTYIDALPDVEAAVAYARKHHAKGKLIIWGSSYSASLVLKVGGDKPGLVDGVVAFSPGEYFKRFGRPANWIQTSASKIHQPVFITSSRKEKEAWHRIYQAIPTGKKHFYLPASKGQHGSSALWRRFQDSPGYWRALKQFLSKYFKGS